jgi:glycosyltransferase involved in cell wall biosynthesis
MHILHIVDYFMPNTGYQENLLAKWNRKEGHEVTVITSDRYYPIEDYDNAWFPVMGARIRNPGIETVDDYKIIRLPILFEFKHRPWIKKLSKTIIKLNPDIIMVHGTGSFNLSRCAFIAKKLGIPCIADNHMIFHVIQKNVFAKIYYYLNQLLIKAYLLKLVYMFIGVSNETCEYLEKIEKIPLNKIFYLPLGIDEEIFNSFSKDNKSKDYFIVTQTGKLSDDKKPQWLAQAIIQLLDKKNYKIKLNLVGGGSKKIIDQIKKSFKKSNLENNLVINDFVEVKKLTSIFQNSDICVYPIGTSLSALEAAACGSVVIMADYPVSIHRESQGIGVTYKTGNISDLARVIENLFLKKRLREKIVENSIKAIQKEYSYKSISRKFTSLCEEAIKSIKR